MNNKDKITTSYLISYLEYKIHTEEIEDDEYGLYIEYKDYGVKVFKMEQNKPITARLLRELKEMDGGDMDWA